MSVETMAVVLHHSRARGTAKVVLLGIANHAGDGGAWPTVATLARYANVTPRNVQKAVEKLEQLGEVSVQLQAGGTLFSHGSDFERPNRYTVIAACPPGCARDVNHRPMPGWERLPDGTYQPVDNPLSKATPGVESDTRPPVGSDTLTVHSTPTNQSPASTTDRASIGETPPCTECHAPDLPTCVARQAKLHHDDRHTYTPRPPRARAPRED